jgi:phosphoglycerate-specific signal transduction histidine kinase
MNIYKEAIKRATSARKVTQHQTSGVHTPNTPLSGMDWVVFTTILELIESQPSNRLNMSMADINHCCKASLGQTLKSLKVLEDSGLIGIHRPGSSKANVYSLPWLDGNGDW